MSTNSEAQKVTEKDVVPNPEGYTLVKYSYLIVSLGYSIGAMLFLPFAEFVLKGDDGNGLVDKWLWWFLFSVFFLLGGVIGHKLTEAKVNIKLSERGLEQTRLSGSRFVPKYRLIPWCEMKRFHLFGRNNSVDFLICTKEGSNFRISMPPVRIFERQRLNNVTFATFRVDFKHVAMKHGVFPAFYKKIDYENPFQTRNINLSSPCGDGHLRRL